MDGLLTFYRVGDNRVMLLSENLADKDIAGHRI